MPGLFYFTNDEGLNVITSNPENEPVVLQEFMTMTSGVQVMIFCRHIILTPKIGIQQNVYANPFQILTGRGGDDLFHIENGAYFALGGAGDDVFTIGDDDFVFGSIMGDITRIWSDEELALAEASGIESFITHSFIKRELQ